MSFNSVGGAALAGPMWADTMRAIQDDLPYANFNSPGSLGAAPSDTPRAPKKEPKKGKKGDGGGDDDGGGNDRPGRGGGGGGRGDDG